MVVGHFEAGRYETQYLEKVPKIDIHLSSPLEFQIWKTRIDVQKM